MIETIKNNLDDVSGSEKTSRLVAIDHNLWGIETDSSKSNESTNRFLSKINHIYETIKQRLNIKDNKEAVAETDKFLIETVKETKTVNDVDTVLIEGAMEDAGKLESIGPNPIDTIEANGYQSLVNEAVTDLKEQNITLPSGEKVANVVASHVLATEEANVDVAKERQAELDKKDDEIAKEWVDYMTTQDEFDVMVANGVPGISIAEYTTAAGKTVKMYNLSGAPYAMLVHGVTFDRGKGFGKFGPNGQKAAEYGENISTWDTTKRGEANDNICCSILSPEYSTNYWKSFDKNGYENVDMSIALGFCNILPDDIRFTAAFDSGTKMDSGEFHRFGLLKTPSKIVRESGIADIAEIVIPRYVDESETTRKPDFIIVNNGLISPTVERAVDYFNIPIINIDVKNSTYGNSFVNKALELIGQNYEELSVEDNAQKLMDINWLVGKARLWPNTNFDSLPKDDILKMFNSVIELEKKEFIENTNQEISELDGNSNSWRYKSLVRNVIYKESVLFDNDNNLKHILHEEAYGMIENDTNPNIDDRFNNIINQKISMLEQIADKIKDGIIFETEHATEESFYYTGIGKILSKNVFNDAEGERITVEDRGFAILYDNKNLTEKLSKKIDEIRDLEDRFRQKVESLRSKG